VATFFETQCMFDQFMLSVSCTRRLDFGYRAKPDYLDICYAE